VRKIADTFTAQAFITTDLDDNQITAFHPGAMNFSHENRIGDARDVTLGIVAPDGRDGMLQHARQFHELGIPFIFDPGQGLPMFDGTELLEFLRRADYCTVNDYEAKLLTERTGKSLEEVARAVKALVVTLGGSGSQIYADGTRIDIPAVPAEQLLDPTGCGDAYRAGLLYGISKGWDWQKTGRLAALMGSIKIAHRGGQNHKPARAEIAARFQAAFGETLD
jgi:adenosine kinase